MANVPSRQILGEGYPFPCAAYGEGTEHYGIKLYAQLGHLLCQSMDHTLLMRYSNKKVRIVLEVIDESDQLELGEHANAAP